MSTGQRHPRDDRRRRSSTRLPSWRSYWPGADIEEGSDSALSGAGTEAADDPTADPTTAEVVKQDRTRRLLGRLALPWRAMAAAVQASWPGADIEEDAPLLDGLAVSTSRAEQDREPVAPVVGLPVRPPLQLRATQADHGAAAGEPDLSVGPPAVASDEIAPDAVAADNVAADDDATEDVTDLASDDELPGSEARRSRRSPGNPLRVPLVGLRFFKNTAHAVYSSLADPIANADEAARERRAARVRLVGQVAASTALAIVLIYAIFPVREYLDQRAQTDRQNETLDVLTEAIEQDERYIEWLLSDEGQELKGRELGYIFPDEEPAIILPHPDDE